MWHASVLCLAILVGMTGLGLVTRYRHELSPLQWFGLLGTFMGTLPRLYLLIDTGSFDASRMPPWASVSVHAGLACYAVGTGWRVVWFKRRRGDRESPQKGRLIGDSS